MDWEMGITLLKCMKYLSMYECFLYLGKDTECLSLGILRYWFNECEHFIDFSSNLKFKIDIADMSGIRLMNIPKIYSQEWFPIILITTRLKDNFYSFLLYNIRLVFPLGIKVARSYFKRYNITELIPVIVLVLLDSIDT